MIASLNGKIGDIFGDSLVVEVGGIGYQVYVPVAVRQQARNGEIIHLHTYLVVRQDALILFGFESREEREFFMLLLEVNGIGPRLALSVLSVLSPDAIRRAVFHEQADVFSRVPGVGKKTAQKILLQLQDRLPADSGLTVGTHIDRSGYRNPGCPDLLGLQRGRSAGSLAIDPTRYTAGSGSPFAPGIAVL